MKSMDRIRDRKVEKRFENKLEAIKTPTSNMGENYISWAGILVETRDMKRRGFSPPPQKRRA